MNCRDTPWGVLYGLKTITDMPFCLSLVLKTRILHIAQGSSAELDYQLLLSHELGYLPESDYAKLITDFYPKANS